MPIVVDINTFPSVFEEENADHAEFSPVKTWIETGKGFLLYGGTKFKEELLTSSRRVRFIRILRDAGRALEINGDIVDALHQDIASKVAGTGCDDPHIIALLAAARCGLLCSRDKRSYPFVKKRKLYPKGAPKVRIYSGRGNIDLLTPCRADKVANVI